jgi:outer membrane protein OmpA-like peptidoglycan-associated protein
MHNQILTFKKESANVNNIMKIKYCTLGLSLLGALISSPLLLAEDAAMPLATNASIAESAPSVEKASLVTSNAQKETTSLTKWEKTEKETPEDKTTIKAAAPEVAEVEMNKPKQDEKSTPIESVIENNIKQIKHYAAFESVGLEKETPTILDSDKDGVPLHLDQCRSTPFGVPVDKKGCATCPPGSHKDTLGCFVINKDTKTYPLHVKFKTDSFIIDNSYKTQIYQLAEFFVASKAPKVTIEGHTDHVGSESSNITLSHNRAQAVAELLKSFGMDPERVKYQGFGEGVPIADNTTRDGRKQNRRVNAVVELVKESKRYISHH